MMPKPVPGFTQSDIDTLHSAAQMVWLFGKEGIVKDIDTDRCVGDLENLINRIKAQLPKESKDA